MFAAEALEDRKPPEVAWPGGHRPEGFPQRHDGAVAGIVGQYQLVCGAWIEQSRPAGFVEADLVGTEVVLAVVAENGDADETVEFPDFVWKNGRVRHEHDFVGDLAESAQVEQRGFRNAAFAAVGGEDGDAAMDAPPAAKLDPSLHGPFGKRFRRYLEVRHLAGSAILLAFEVDQGIHPGHRGVRV